MASREAPDGFWMRFVALYEDWCKGVDHFARAEVAWGKLEAFMADAPSDAWEDARRLKADNTALSGLVNGALKSQVDGQVDVVEVDQLIEELRTEVEGALPRLEGLAQRIANCCPNRRMR